MEEEEEEMGREVKEGRMRRRGRGGKEEERKGLLWDELPACALVVFEQNVSFDCRPGC